MSSESREPGAAPERSHTETVRLAERAAVLILLAVLLYGVVRVLEPFGLAIAFGGFIAIGTWPAREALVRAGLRRGLAAILLLLGLFVLVAVPVLLMAPDLADQIRGVVTAAREALQNLSPTPPGWLSGLPLSG